MLSWWLFIGRENEFAILILSFQQTNLIEYVTILICIFIIGLEIQ